MTKLEVEKWWRGLDYERKVEISDDYFAGIDDPDGEWFNLDYKQKLKIYKLENR